MKLREKENAILKTLEEMKDKAEGTLYDTRQEKMTAADAFARVKKWNGK